MKDEEQQGVTTQGGDEPQEENAASEETEEEIPQEPSQDDPEPDDDAGEGDEPEESEDSEKTDRGTKTAKEPESRYYQQVKNENADMRRLLGDPKALKAYLREVEGTKAPEDAKEDDLKKIVDEATMDNGQVDAYKLARLMDERSAKKIDQGMKHLASDMERNHQWQRSYDSDKAQVRNDHPELDPKSDKFDSDLEAFVGERFIAQGGYEGKTSLKQVVDQTFKWLETVKGSAKKDAETEVVRKRVGAIPKDKASASTSKPEEDMSPEEILAKRVQKQLQRN